MHTGRLTPTASHREEKTGNASVCLLITLL